MPAPKEPQPALKLHRRRTEDEALKAIDAYETGKSPQRDDEWGLILRDVLAECIEWRRIGMYVTQDLQELHGKIMSSIKTMGQ